MNAWSVTLDAPQPFERMSRTQARLVDARYEGRIPDTVIFLEHEPVVTLGRRGRTEHLLLSPDQLRARGIDFRTASRGGDVTYHAPGQLVLYPILKLGALKADAHGYLFNLEEIAIRTCADFGVDARRVEGKNGAWTDAGKIAAIGFHLKRGITLHGMSFNVDPDLAGFKVIVPCGLSGDPVCSLKSIQRDAAPPLSDVRARMAAHFEDVCGRRLEPKRPDELPAFFELA